MVINKSISVPTLYDNLKLNLGEMLVRHPVYTLPFNFVRNMYSLIMIEHKFSCYITEMYEPIVTNKKCESPEKEIS